MPIRWSPRSWTSGCAPSSPASRARPPSRRSSRPHDADRASLAEVLARAVRTEKFIEGRVRLRSQVPESEVRKAWEADKGGKSWEDARGPLRERMQRERAYVLAREALAQLRTSIPVRIIARPDDLAREQLGLGEAAR